MHRGCLVGIIVPGNRKKMSIRTGLRNIINRTSICLAVNKCTVDLVAKCSTNAFLQYDKDPGPQFTNPDIQKLLRSMTRLQLEKVFKRRSVPDNSIEYKFLTTEQLENELQEAKKKAEKYIQMPPIVMIKKEKQKIISKDPALQNFSSAKFVFTDITYGLKHSERKVVIRQTDGTLEYAPQDVHKRMNQLYFPSVGRQMRVPRMFEPEHLQRCIDEFKYEFILDRICVQYEPYEKEFHDISSKVYMHINENKRFDDLRSTRHFGPMAFFLAWHKIIDDLLYDMIKRDYLRNGVEVIALMYQLNGIDYDKKIHQKLEEIPESQNTIREVTKSNTPPTDDIYEEIKNAIGKTSDDFKADEICFEFIESYVKTKALKKVPLEMALQTLRETNDEKKKLFDGLKKAHGIS